MHAAALAEELGIETVVIPRSCGVLSAYGLLAAPERQDRVQTVRTLAREADPDRLGEVYERLETEARARLSGGTSDAEAESDAGRVAPAAGNDETADGERSRSSARTNRSVTIRRAADLRYRGQSFELTVPVDPKSDLSGLVEAFHEAHRTTYGYRMDDPVELVNLRLTARRPTRRPSPAFAGGDGRPRSERKTRFHEETIPTPVYDWAELKIEQTLAGPAVVERNESTALVPPGWSTTVRPDGSLRLTATTTR